MSHEQVFICFSRIYFTASGFKGGAVLVPESAIFQLPSFIALVTTTPQSMCQSCKEKTSETKSRTLSKLC